MRHVAARVLWVVLPLLPVKMETRYLPMNYEIDASIATAKDSAFIFLKDNKIAVTVKWNGKKYVIKDDQ